MAETVAHALRHELQALHPDHKYWGTWIRPSGPPFCSTAPWAPALYVARPFYMCNFALVRLIVLDGVVFVEDVRKLQVVWQPGLPICEFGYSHLLRHRWCESGVFTGDSRSDWLGYAIYDLLVPDSIDRLLRDLGVLLG